MQQNLHAFLGISDSDSEPAGQNIHFDQLQKGNHYWTGVKTEGQLALPGISDYELMAEILTLQYSKDYSKVASQTSLEYIFDPDTYDIKDPTLWPYAWCRARCLGGLPVADR